MGKLKQTKNNLTKKQKYLEKKRNKFNSGILSIDELYRIPIEKRIEYIKRELKKKFGGNINFKCPHCASITLYENDGYITDEDLLNHKKIQKSFKRK